MLADSGVTIEPARQLVRERLGAGSPSDATLPFSPEAKKALRSANRFGLGTPGTEHLLIVLVGRGEGGASDILRALGADPHQIRFETKKRAWQSSVPEPGATSGRVQLVGTVPAESAELEFDD